jgi:phosphoglycolate phosphatase-like HAD superfamily hydrolase
MCEGSGISDAYGSVMLILFDIDATLTHTSSVGIKAIVRTGQRLFGPQFSEVGIDVAGRLDPLIIGEMLERAGAARNNENIAKLREGYVEAMRTELFQPGISRACPGMPELLRALQARSAATLGLLTGNFEQTGLLKIQACGYDPEVFRVRVWGDDSPLDPPARDHLPPVAMERYAKLMGKPIAGSQVTIIGDTPHDVRCAKVNGCRVLGVATGRYDVATLEAHGADLAVPTVEDTARVAKWLLG